MRHCMNVQGRTAAIRKCLLNLVKPNNAMLIVFHICACESVRQRLVII